MRYDNECRDSFFVEKLSRLTGQSVLLFGQDAMSYFGTLERITRDGKAVLSPSPLADSGLVEILNPSEAAAGENSSIVDVSDIVAFGYDITGDPFTMPDDNDEDVGEPTVPTLPRLPAYAPDGRVRYPGDSIGGGSVEDVLDFLGRHSSATITFATLGGFLFAGRVENLSHNTVLLSVDFIFAPGGDGSTLFFVGKVRVDLDFSTSLSY